MENLLIQIWIVWCRMAPYLILGFLVAGALYIWIRPSFVQRHLGGGRFAPVLKATLLGIPLPLCSCGVIPVAASLRRQGAGKGATTAFLLATPQTGVDSIAVTYSLMGGFFAVFRPLAALVSGIAGGMIVSLFERNGRGGDRRSNEDGHAGAGGNGSGSESMAVAGATHTGEEEDDGGSCCGGSCGSDGNSTGTGDDGHRKHSLLDGLRYGLVTLPSDIGRALLIGVVLAGAIGAFAPPDLFADLPGGTLVQMLFMMAVGIPLYVCATASVPVAAALMMKGISPGAALVFLITGPATNAAAISTIWKIMGRRTAVIYLAVVAVFALLSGLAADLLMGGMTVHAGHMHQHDTGLGILEIVSGIALIGIMAVAIGPWRKRAAPVAAHQDVPQDAARAAARISPASGTELPDGAVPAGGAQRASAANPDASGVMTFNVRGMRCSHCAGMIRQNLESVPGVTRVDVSLETGVVAVRGIGLDRQSLGTIITNLGYDPVGARHH